MESRVQPSTEQAEASEPKGACGLGMCSKPHGLDPSRRLWVKLTEEDAEAVEDAIRLAEQNLLDPRSEKVGRVMRTLLHRMKGTNG